MRRGETSSRAGLIPGCDRRFRLPHWPTSLYRPGRTSDRFPTGLGCPDSDVCVGRQTGPRGGRSPRTRNRPELAHLHHSSGDGGFGARWPCCACGCSYRPGPAVVMRITRKMTRHRASKAICLQPHSSILPRTCLHPELEPVVLVRLGTKRAQVRADL